jgi:hypothetical protein
MASLPNNTFASPGNPFYALVAGGGGGGGSSLQSPATITPDANGAVALSMTATDVGNDGAIFVISNTAGGGGANLTISDTSPSQGSTSVLTLVNEVSGGSVIAMGTAQNGFLIIAPGGAYDGSMFIGQTNLPGLATVAIDTIGGSVTLGNPVVVPGTNPIVTASNPLVALQPVTVQGAAPGTGMFLNASGAVPSIFADAALQVGTVAHTNILTVADAPTPNVGITGALGVTGAVSVVGSVGASGNIISSAGNVQVVSGGSVSSSATVAAGGVLNLQNATNTATPQITLSNANTTINGLVLLPGTLSFQGQGTLAAFNTLQTLNVTCADNSTTSIPNPTGGVGLVKGLYLIMARGAGAQAGQAACTVTTISYFDGLVWAWGGGGCCPALVTSPPSYIGIQSNAGSTLILANGGGVGAVTMSFVFLQLGGDLGI